MDYGRANELMLSLRHRHNDGSWSPLEPRTTHDPATSDPERSWASKTIYVCKACEEEVWVEPLEDPAAPSA